MNDTYTDGSAVYGDAPSDSMSDSPAENQSIVAQAFTSLDLTGRMARNPYQTLLIAAGVGYILGGGLFTKLTANTVRLGVRVGGHPIVQRELFGIAEALLARRSNPSS